ncbi:uncharacterized protein LOC129235452 [Anastrepha obliqua]|uniref:uncharacterized protein LOC129235452 n=1 Tax=Anastrepha obliqua TaxID=95512 RepID=UPI00240A6BAF|nr:uncharacterized protein LOC129235452 [Anastrepha obliqua]
MMQSVQQLELGDDLWFQHDNDPKQSAYNVKLWLLYNTKHQLRTPPQSPDLNPIEHFLERRIRQHNISTSSEACNANRSEESSYTENDQPIMKKDQETYQFNPEHKITLGHPLASKTGMINNKSQSLHAKQTISDNKISPGVNNNIPIEKKFIPNDLLELEEETVYGSPPACSKMTADHRNKEKDTETACNVTDESSSIVSEECYTKNIEKRKTASNDQEKISNLIASGSQIDENLLSFENQVNFGAGANANCTIRKDYSNIVESDQQIPSHFIEIANMAEGPEIDGTSVSPNPTETTNLEVDPEVCIQDNVNKVKSKLYLKELQISDSDIKIDKDAITEDQIESNKSKNIIFEKVISHPVTHGDKYNNNVSSLEETDSNLILKNPNENSAIINAKLILKNNDDTANVPRFEVKDLLSERIQEHINENYELPPHSNNQITPKRSSDIAINEELIPKGNEETGPSSFEIKEVISDKTDAKVVDNCESASHLDETISVASDKVSEVITNAKFTLKENENATNESSFEAKEVIPEKNHGKMDENYESPPHSYEQISIDPNKGSETSIKETILSKSNEEIKNPSSCEIKEVISDKSVERVADNNESVPHLIESISLVPVKMPEAVTNAKFTLKENETATNESSFEAKELIPARNHDKMDENYESPPHSAKPVAVAPNKVSETSVKETIISKSNEEIKSTSSCEIEEEISDKTDSKVADNCESASHLDKAISLASDKVSEVITNAKFILKNNDDTTNVSSFEDKELIPAGNHEKTDENFESPPHSYEQISIAPNKGSETSIKETILSKSNEEIKNPSSCEIKQVISDKSVERVADNNESVPHLIESISLVPVKMPEAVTNAKFTLKENETATNESSFEAKELIPARNHGKMDENYESPPHSTEPVAIAPNKMSDTSVKETIISKSNEEMKSTSSCEIEEEISDKTGSKVADNCESASHLDKAISLASDKVSEIITNAELILKNNDDTTNVPSFEAKELIPARNHDKMDENFESPPHSYEQISIAPNKGSETSIKETILSKSNEEIKNPSSCEIKQVISDKSVERVADNNESVPHLIESISLVPVKMPEAVTNAKFTLKENENATNESSFEAKELIPARNHGKMDENYESPPHSTEPVAIAPNKMSDTSVKETIISKSNEEMKSTSSCEIEEEISDKTGSKVADNCESASHLDKAISLASDKVSEIITNAELILKNNDDTTNVPSFEAKELIPARNHDKMDENFESPPHSYEQISIAPNKGSEISIKETIISKSNEEIKSSSSCEIKEVISDKSDERVADNNESVPHLIESISLVPVKVPEAVTNVKFTLKENENATNESSFEAKELTPGRNHGKMDENYESPPHSTEPVAIAPNKMSDTSVKETIISKSNEEIKSTSSCEIEEEISDKTDSKVADNYESASHLDKAISLASDKVSEIITNAELILKNNDDTTIVPSFEDKELIPAGNHEKFDENFISPPHEQISIAPNKGSEISIKETIISKSNEEIKSPSSCEIKEVISDKSDERVADNNESVPHLIESISLVPVKVPEAVTNVKFTLKENENATNESSFEAKELTPGRNHGKMDENYESPPHSTEPVAIAPNKMSDTSVKETIISKSNEEMKSTSSCEIEEEISDKTGSKVADNCESASHLDKAISLASDKVSEIITNAELILKNNDDTTIVPSFEDKELIPAGNHEKMDENFISPPHEQISIAPNKGSEISIKETILSKSNEEIKNPSSCEIKEVISDKSVERVTDNNESVPHLIESISLVPVKVSEAVTMKDENYESPPHSTKPVAIAPNKVSETSVKETIISKSNEEMKSTSSCEIEEEISDKTGSKVADNCESASHLDKAISLASDKVSEIITNAELILKNNDDTTIVPSFEDKELIPAGNHEKMDENFISPPHEQISIAPNKESETSIKETIISKSSDEIKNIPSFELTPHLDKIISPVPNKLTEVITNAKFILKDNEDATNESSFEAKEEISKGAYEKMDEHFDSPPHSNEQISIAPNKSSDTAINEETISRANEEKSHPSSLEMKETANGNFTSDNIIGSRNPNGVVGTNNSKPNVERMMYQKKTKQSNKDNVKDNVKDHFIGRPLDARVAEIHLKSFKTDVKMPWYENGTLINTEFRNEISKNDIECTSPRNRQNSSGIVLPLPTVGDVCNKTEILNSLNDSACEKDSLEISSPKETDIEEDSLEIGLITEDKPPLNNTSNKTRTEVLNKSGVQTECICPNESTSDRKHLNETDNAIHYNIEHTETPIDMECQKKLFEDLKKVEGLTGIKSENTETTEEELHFRKTSLQDSARFYLSKPDNHFTAKPYELIKEQKPMNTLNAETFGRNNSFDEIEGGEFTINGLDTIIEVNEGDNKDGMKNENETDFSSETASDLSSSWTESKESDEFILSEEFEGIFETFSSNRPKSFNTIAEVQGGIYETKKIKINADEELGLEDRNLKSKHKNNLLNYTEKENNSAESSLTLLIKMGIEDQDTSESKSKNCNSPETTSINATKSKYEEDVSKNIHQAAAAIQSNSAKYLAASIIQRNIRRYLDSKRKEMDSGFPGKQEGLPVNLESENTNKSEFQVSFNSETTLKETENLKKDYRDRYESSHEINIEEPHVNQHNKRKNLITSKKWTNEKAAAVIQKAYKTYLYYKCKERNTEISHAVHKYNNKLSANQCTSKKNSLVESDATPCPTSESKVNWFVGVEPIKTSMELNKITQNLPEAKPLFNNYESGPDEVNINTALILPEDSIGIQRNLQRDADPISNSYFIPRNQDSGEDGAQVNNSISETIQVVYNFLFAERRLYLKSRDENNQQIIDDSKSFDYSECIETCVPFEHLQKFAETTQNEGDENHFIDEAANKLRGTDELVDNMQKRLLCRSSSFDSANEKVRRQRSFEEPVIWVMQDIQESKKSTPDTEDDKVVVKPMEIEDTRESSGLSESIIISHMSIDEDENDRLENPLKIEEAFERHFTKPLEDSELSVGTIMNDNVEEYFHSEKHTYKNKTNSCSIYLDDDTSENIRKKMMASSLTETESDASDDPISDSRATQLTDFNICTIINDTTGTSSDTESTIISTAEKAHGVDNPIRLKSDDTIDQSSEILAEENSPKKMSTSYRNYHRKRDLELRNTIARRMTFQRGDAIRNDSMPDEEKLCSTNIEQQKGSIEKYISHSKGEPWPGARLDVVLREDIPNRPRSRAWIPEFHTDPEEVLELLKLGNPELPTSDWKVAKIGEVDGKRRLAVIILNEESLDPLANLKWKVNYGFQSLTLHVYRQDVASKGSSADNLTSSAEETTVALDNLTDDEVASNSGMVGELFRRVTLEDMGEYSDLSDALEDEEYIPTSSDEEIADQTVVGCHLTTHTNDGGGCTDQPPPHDADNAVISVESCGRTIWLASSYMAHDAVQPPPSPLLRGATEEAARRGIPLILGADANAHHHVWGSTDTNERAI